MVVYAKNTTFSVERSRAEIESVLHRYGCKAFGYRYCESEAIIEFATADRHVRFNLKLPPKENYKYRLVRKWKTPCTPEQQNVLWEQACRQRWRTLSTRRHARLSAI